MSFWDNIDGLQRLLSIIIIAWAVISAALGIFSWKIQSRISELTSFKQMALERELTEAQRKASEFRDKPTFPDQSVLTETFKPKPETIVIPKTIIEKTEPEPTRVTKQEVEEQKPQVITFENSAEQKFIQFLSNKPKGDFTIKCISGDEGSFRYAKEIEKLLIAAGYKSNGIAQTVFRTPPKGVSIIVKGINSAPPYAGAIQKAFELIGIDAPAEVNAYYPENTLTLVVGQKAD
ncbi:MAG: hypothetical protein N3D80_03105 [Ignavibacterium album]|uniref:hypothetical protein n=1 Tax=Ignavibacterium album TaxID=591197 RepID=UPI0026F3417A|nr:hypothetical protein [Ignavibacterium album]MCX8104846.1 hypothetical protein [Ignavibacterium album]